MTIDIIDAGLGNIRSVANMVTRAGGEARVISTPDAVRQSKKLILPGVGAFDEGVGCLQRAGLIEPLRDAVSAGAGLLGVCLGMQLLFDESEEGRLPGLGMIRGRVKRFRIDDQGLKIPHMGWNIVRPSRASTLFPSLDDEYRFYFVHSYYAECESIDDSLALSHYGIDFTCAVQRGNVFGVQFHPEKSHRFGMSLLARFAED
jgi:glutamine amidotransferase